MYCVLYLNIALGYVDKEVSFLRNCGGTSVGGFAK